VPVNAENTFLLFKERRPFKLKKEYPLEQWQIISFRLIPLKTPVSFRWTVPLSIKTYRHQVVHEPTKVNSCTGQKLKNVASQTEFLEIEPLAHGGGAHTPQDTSCHIAVSRQQAAVILQWSIFISCVVLFPVLLLMKVSRVAFCFLHPLTPPYHFSALYACTKKISSLVTISCLDPGHRHEKII
jgi:hypothetical protein